MPSPPVHDASVTSLPLPKFVFADEALTEMHPRTHLPSRYIVERADPALWAKVLDEANEHRASLIEQVVGTALPESRNPEQVRTRGTTCMRVMIASPL